MCMLLLESKLGYHVVDSAIFGIKIKTCWQVEGEILASQAIALTSQQAIYLAISLLRHKLSGTHSVILEVNIIS